jgi:methionine-rich copper-binding protein CopC
MPKCKLWSFWPVLVLVLAPAALSHAIVLSVTPKLHQVLSGPDIPIELRFNSKIDVKRSRLILVGPDGGRIALPVSEEAARDCLKSEAKGLKTGAYVLRWQVLAADGHITRGEVPFSVQ